MICIGIGIKSVKLEFLKEKENHLDSLVVIFACFRVTKKGFRALIT